MDHDMSGMNGKGMTMDHSQPGGMLVVDAHQHQGMALGKAGFGSTNAIIHVPTEFGPQVDMRADSPQNGLNDPGIGLRDHARL